LIKNHKVAQVIAGKTLATKILHFTMLKKNKIVIKALSLKIVIMKH
jgi:hypothetical protein